MLTGRRPRKGRQAVYAEYPHNLFALLAGTHRYDMVVFEPYTSLCPPGIEPTREPAGGPVGQALHTLPTLLAVYLHHLVPADAQHTAALERAGADDHAFVAEDRTYLLQRFIHRWSFKSSDLFVHRSDFTSSFVPGDRRGRSRLTEPCTSTAFSSSTSS